MLLTSLFEASTNSAVLGWGRGMGHKGHMLLAQAVLHHAEQLNAKAYFVVSRTSLVDPATGQPWADRPTFTKTKDDPLTPEEKLATYRKVFPQNAEVFSVASADATKLEQVLAKIAKDGYRNVTLVVGEDQKNSMGYLTNPDKSGVPPFKQAGLDNLTIISRQDTKAPGSDPSAPDYQEGPRATPMRAVLTDPTKSEEEQFAVWRDAMPDNLSDDEVMDLMNKAKQRMAAIPPKKGAAPVAEDQVDELDVSKTLKFATKAHSKQKYGDKPYISHPRSVASTGKKFFGAAFTTDAIKVALLHDIVEDTPYKLEQLAKMGYAPEVVQAVELLTKNKNLSYADNIKAIIASGNKLAMMVKYADNYQNFTGDKSDWDTDRAAHSQKKYLASLDMLGNVLGVNKHQSTESLNESVKPQASIIFDTYNPPNKDSIDGWKVAAKTKFWFVGTDKKRKDSKNPLPYEIKLVCMETAWPLVKTHIKNVNNLLELAAEAYKETGEIELFVCTNKESEYKKVLQYNGHKGPHGYYDFERITRRAVPYYRHDKALKTALLDKDKDAFKQATGIDPEKKVVANHVRYEYYDLLEKFLIKRSLSETRLIELEETVRMSAAVKLQRAWDQQQAKSAASRKRGQELLNPPKPQEPKKDEKVAEGSLNEFAPDGFNGGDDDEGFSPEIAKMAQDDGFTKGAGLADGATLERAMAINHWHSTHGGMYKQYFAKGFKAGRMDKIRHNNKQYNLNLKLMKDGSIRHGEQGVAEGLPQTLRKVVPGHAKREIDRKMDAGKFGKTDADKDANFQRYKKIQDKLKEQGVAEGAPIVVMPRSDRIKKAEPTKVRYQGDIVPPTNPPSTERRGVKGRPGQRPMPDYDKVSEKIKGADGKACWDGYRYNGTENGSDKCVKVSEDIEDKMASLIRLLENK